MPPSSDLRDLDPPLPSDAYAASVAFFENSIDAVLFTAPDGRILDANAAACRMLAMPRDEICRRGRRGLADPADDRWIAGVEERNRTGRFVGRLSFRRGDGTKIELDISSAVFANSDGELRTVIVMREAPKHATVLDDLALIDRSGISNRPAFIHLAEQQLRKATRDRLALMLVYVRSGPYDRASLAEREAACQELAVTLSAECRIGDVVGRVAENDFAMLVSGHEADDMLAVVRLIAARIQERDERRSTVTRVHVGFMALDPNAHARFVEVLTRSRESMDGHDEQEPSDNRISQPCLFALADPSVPVSVEFHNYDASVSLSERELEVLRLLAARRSYQEIAQGLYVSLNTVKSHVSHIYTKLGVNGRKPAIERARELGLFGIGAAPRATVERGTSDRDVREEQVDLGRIALVARALTAAVDADDILEIIAMQGFTGLHADAAIVTFIIRDALVPVAIHGYTEESVTAFFPAALDENLPLTVAARGQELVCVPNRADAQRRFPALAASPLARSSAWIAAPLVAEGQTFGAFGVSFSKPHDFSESEREYIRTLSDMGALALHRERDHYLIPDDVLGDASLVMRFRRESRWPRGAWLLRDVSRIGHKRLAAAGYGVIEERDGRVIVEPPKPEPARQ